MWRSVAGVCLALLLLSDALYAQDVRGTIRDADTGEGLFGATVFAPALGRGTNTGPDGRFRLDLPAGEHALRFSYVGYVEQTRTVRVGDAPVDITVELAAEVLEEVVVTADGLREQFHSSQMSVERLSPRDAKMLPALFGEVDVIKTLQLKPGIQSGGEGTSGLYVRGGGPDQNLMLLDGAQLYNANHLFGFFSVFNADAVDRIELYKGGFPAEYGGRLSSVVDVSTRPGDRERFRGTGGVGLISSRLTLEGPLGKRDSVNAAPASFLLSGRRTYFDIFTRQINRANEGRRDYNPIPDYYFYDLNGRLDFRLSARDQFSFSGYFGRDVFGFQQNLFKINFDWGNTAAVLNWRHQFNPRLYVENRYLYTDYQYRIRNRFDVFDFQLGSRVTDQKFRTDFHYAPNEHHNIKFGSALTYHTFDVGRADAGDDAGEFSFQAGRNLYATEVDAYVSDQWDVSQRWQVEGGLRWAGFANGDAFYHGLEPRLAARYLHSEAVSFKANYARMRQYVHLVTNSGASLPTDVWYPSTPMVPPQTSDQVAAGVSLLLFGDRFLLSNEAYYKWLDDQIDFRDGANLLVNDNLDAEFVFGRGWSYGNEIYLEKKQGRTTGWVGYTLSWTFRQFDDINEGRTFFPRYDRRHDVSVVAMHRLSDRLTLTGAWVYGTGNAITLPVGRFLFQDQGGTTAVPPGVSVIPDYQERNGFRQAAYHRLDLGLVWKFNPKWGESDLTFSVYNLYNRRNPFFVFFEDIREDDVNRTGNITGFRAKQVSLFPVIPSVAYN
ncbi:MAG: TonB-dependent receptor, partial [Catalinimonas sp.]